MFCTITKITELETFPEHWRILIVDKDEEVYHDSATNENAAIALLTMQLGQIRITK